MNNEDETHQSERRFMVSNDESLRLLTKMFRLGYFHNQTPSPDDFVTGKRSCNETVVGKSEQLFMLVEPPSDDTILITMSQLKNILEKELDECGGWLPLSSPSVVPTTKKDRIILNRMLKNPVYAQHVHRAAGQICEECQKKSKVTAELFPKIQIIQGIRTNGLELISSTFLENVVQETFALFDQDNEEGRIMISQVSRLIFQLPADILYTALHASLTSSSSSSSPCIGRPGFIINNGGKGGTKQLLSPKYIHRKKTEVYESLRHAKEPVIIDFEWCQNFEWDAMSVLNHVKYLCSNELRGEAVPPVESTDFLDGELHLNLDRNHSLNSFCEARYIPVTYLRTQRESICDFFSSNGYISFRKCISLGVTKSRVEAYLKDLFPSAIFLLNFVINKENIILPIQACLYECIQDGNVSDLTPLFPSEFLSSRSFETDIKQTVSIAVKNIMTTHDSDSNSCVDSNLGTTVMTDSMVLYFSNDLIHRIESKILPSIIDKYAKLRAVDITKNESSQQMVVNGNETTSVKSSAKKSAARFKTSRKGSTGAIPSNEFKSTEEVIPLHLVVSEISRLLPDLDELQRAYHDKMHYSSTNEDLSWEESEINAGDKHSGGPIAAFCRSALYKDDFKERCRLAIRAELEVLLRFSRGMVLPTKSAVQRKNIISAFEDDSCFMAACYFVQLLAKLPQALANTMNEDRKLVEMLESDFLRGCATNFTKRLTQYCLFLNDIDDSLFTYDAKLSSGTHSSCQDLFYHPVNISARLIEPSYLSCQPNEDGSMRDPLKVLQERLPDGLGEALCQMWILTGDEHYYGGQRIGEDGSPIMRKGNISEFLRHAEENCLLICGMPFKVLEKKAEKLVLQARLRDLHVVLQASSDFSESFDLTVMILMQKIRGFVVTGPLLSTEILTMIMNDRRMSSDLSAKLHIFAEKLIDNNCVFTKNMIDAVKEIGLSGLKMKK